MYNQRLAPQYYSPQPQSFSPGTQPPLRQNPLQQQLNQVTFFQPRLPGTPSVLTTSTSPVRPMQVLLEGSALERDKVVNARLDILEREVNGLKKMYVDLTEGKQHPVPIPPPTDQKENTPEQPVLSVELQKLKNQLKIKERIIQRLTHGQERSSEQTQGALDP